MLVQQGNALCWALQPVLVACPMVVYIEFLRTTSRKKSTDCQDSNSPRIWSQKFRGKICVNELSRKLEGIELQKNNELVDAIRVICSLLLSLLLFVNH